MPKNSIADYSTTAASNTDIGGVSIAEGMAPSDVNNALREQMKQLADYFQGNSQKFSGRALFGTTADGASIGFNSQVAVDGSATVAALVGKNDDAGGDVLVSWNAVSSGDPTLVSFYTEVAATRRGGISYNRGAGLVAYNTTSDRRSKDLFGAFSGSGEIIDAIPVHVGLMHGATIQRPMFVADEVEDGGASFAVTGERDAEYADGSPKYQQLDNASLVPVLWAEIRSLRARVAALEAQ